MVETGIWGHVEKSELRAKQLSRKPAIASEKSKDDKPVNIATLKGTWPTVFVLVGCFISVTIPVFIVECRRIAGKLVKNVGVVILKRYRRPRRKIDKRETCIAIAVCDAGKQN